MNLRFIGFGLNLFSAEDFSGMLMRCFFVHL